CVQGTHWPCSF
nr:immunoglobulin light chain junction region [Macaca mulatta]MOX52897.1 immunoglobulin light chain junction region [Macaca mulatta]MOX55323.1 immunoglobulin light chain junction region [Macaca mulatta]